MSSPQARQPLPLGRLRVLVYHRPNQQRNHRRALARGLHRSHNSPPLALKVGGATATETEDENMTL